MGEYSAESAGGVELGVGPINVIVMICCTVHGAVKVVCEGGGKMANVSRVRAVAQVDGVSTVRAVLVDLEVSTVRSVAMRNTGEVWICLQSGQWCSVMKDIQWTCLQMRDSQLATSIDR